MMSFAQIWEGKEGCGWAGGGDGTYFSCDGR